MSRDMNNRDIKNIDKDNKRLLRRQAFAARKANKVNKKTDITEDAAEETIFAGDIPEGAQIPEGFVADKVKDVRGTVKQLLQYTRAHWIAFVVVVVMAIAGTALAVVGPKVLGNAMDVIFDGMTGRMAYDSVLENMPAGTVFPEGTMGKDIISKLPAEAVEQIPDNYLESIQQLDFSSRPSVDMGKLGSILLFLLGLYVFSMMFSYVEGFLLANVSQKISYRLRDNISKKINKMPLKYFDSRPFGDVLSRITNDVDTITSTLNQVMVPVITGVVSILAIVGIMLSISWLLTLVILLVIPLSGVFIALIVKKSQKYFRGNQRSVGQLNGHVEEMYAGHNVVKAFNGEEMSVEQFGKINKELYNYNWKSEFFSSLMMPITGFINNLGYVVVCILGGYMAVQRVISVGDIQSVILYIQQLNNPISQIAQAFNMIQSGIAASERVFEFLGESDEPADAVDAVSTEGLKGSVVFDKVVFGYNQGQTVINDFNINVQKGQRVAIVGPTGAGKTTIVNLLMRFYDVNSGSIRIDGVDITDLRRSELRRMMGMVLQDTWLFNGTIRDNIAYGKIGATDAEVRQAARIAYVDHFVRTLPEGYDTVLNEEISNISQGQKQLLTIARAVLADPEVLILDEATSSVDTRTEVLIQKAMDNLMRNRTCFVIAHRLSTVRDSDTILVMRDGAIVEQGSHEDLLAQNGFYSELYNSQFDESA